MELNNWKVTGREDGDCTLASSLGLGVFSLEPLFLFPSFFLGYILLNWAIRRARGCVNSLRIHATLDTVLAHLGILSSFVIFSHVHTECNALGTNVSLPFNACFSFRISLSLSPLSDPINMAMERASVYRHLYMKL